LIGLARDQRILLPVAGAHLTEMAPVAGRRRRDLAATILGLCRGWQMQNPVRVRGQEFAASMLGQDPVAADVFTLEPGVLFTQGPAPPAPMPGAPPDLAEILTRVIAISALYSAMLEDEPVDMGEGKAAAERWATNFPQLAMYMREQRMSAEHARINARARLIADQGEDIARAADHAGVTQKRFAEWLADEFPEDLARMPYVGRLGEVLYLRLRNADDKWEAHDLNDMNFLCAAAAYADVTVGEKKTIEYLRRVEPQVCPGLTALLTAQRGCRGFVGPGGSAVTNVTILVGSQSPSRKPNHNRTTTERRALLSSSEPTRLGGVPQDPPGGVSR
jgi:hypothetical protein